MSEPQPEPLNNEDRVESLSSPGGRGDRVYQTLLTKALSNGWPIPDRAKAKAILISMQDLSNPSPRVRAAAARNLAMFDRLNVTRERTDAISKLAETPLLTREDLLTNLEVLRQQRLLLATEEATESTNILSATSPPTKDLETQRLGQNSLSELAIPPPHSDVGAQSPGSADAA